MDASASGASLSREERERVVQRRPGRTGLGVGSEVIGNWYKLYRGKEIGAALHRMS